MAALANGDSGVVEHLGVRIDRARQTVSAHDRNVTLTPTEYRLLRFLIDRPGQVCTRQELLAAAIGGGAIVGERTIDVHVFSLRRKLAIPQFIQTVRGVGYVLRKS
jgi:DNA-binding response OmpR family regulator